MSIFGWDLPPGCTQQQIDEALGGEGLLDCPVCNDGVEMNGPDCADCRYVTCGKHGCVTRQELEKLRPIPPDPCEGLAGQLAEEELLIFADLDEHPEHAITYNSTVFAKWRATRGK